MAQKDRFLLTLQEGDGLVAGVARVHLQVVVGVLEAKQKKRG